jgi:hypothetical protein
MPGDIRCQVALFRTDREHGGTTHRDNQSTFSIRSASTEDQRLLSQQMPAIQYVNTVDRNMITEKCTRDHVYVSASTVEYLVLIPKRKCETVKG